jgi:acyl carrier protein
MEPVSKAESDELAARVRRVIARHLHVEETDAVDDANMRNDLGADSLDDVEIAMALEEEFGLAELPDNDIEAARTVGDMIRLVRAKVAA